jgi:subtilisin-like proprotein convertase family protein
VTKNGQLTEAVDGTLKNPTIEIEIKESAITEFQTAQDPVDVFNKAIDNKDISVKGNGFINQLKVNVLLGNPLLPQLIINLLSPSNQTQATG